MSESKQPFMWTAVLMMFALFILGFATLALLDRHERDSERIIKLEQQLNGSEQKRKFAECRISQGVGRVAPAEVCSYILDGSEQQ